jgi:carboxyl-terminal processing protease
MVEGDIGYVRLASFTEQTVGELKSALKELQNEHGMNSLILDLRSNGGGLLDQAVGVVSLFVPKEKLVVYTQGRSAKRDRQYYSDGSALFTSGRMVVLVDSGSASASEIVAGALQDWDRAVIMGQETFGKGLVQNVFEWPEHDVALKLTTSKYYIPSGRSIQKRTKLRKRDVRIEAASRVIEYADDPKSKETFKTTAGRLVNGNGGITPDVLLQSGSANELVEQLTRENLFFRFALEYKSVEGKAPRDVVVDGRTLSQFENFIEQSNFRSKSHLESSLDRLEEIAKHQDVSRTLSNEIDALRRAIGKLNQGAFDVAKDAIALEIKRELLRSQYSSDVVYEEVVLENDIQVKAAVSLIKDKGRYQNLLKP